ncbi:MAG: sigma-70 family RNA polymerase sigma factor [Bacteroidaceae bacterium]|nr:sigma-70 family RNA polymerase sigma factor [Bacteroidaceae bacterium]
MFSMEVTQLIERCRQGDADALGELYKTYAQRMRGVCRRFVSDEQTISDVLHDSFVIIFTSFDKLRDDRKAEAWMMSITRNVASKYKDHLAKMTFVQLEDAEQLQAPGGESEVRGVPLEDVMQLVDRLPEGYGQVFRLSVFEGLSHKEIANMMGIEPHSSSSQLARAKKMLRKMMQRYWVATLLLLLVPITFYLFRKGDSAVKDEKPVVANQKDTRKESKKEPRTDDDGKQQTSPQKPMIVHVTKHHPTITTTDSLPLQIAQATDSTTTDTLFNMIAQEQSNTDTIPNDTSKTVHELEIPHYDIADFLPQKPATGTRHQQKWSVDLAYVGGLGEQNYNRPYGFTETPMIATTGEPPSPVTFENWSDYAAFWAEMPDDGSSHSRSVVMNIALNNAGDAPGTGTDKIVRKSHHYMPVNISLALKYRLNNRFALETGLGYSRLKSEFEMGSNGNTISEQQTIHYLGIPVKGTYNIYNRKAWSLYGSLGVTTEIPLYSPLYTSYYLHGILEDTDNTTIRAPWQWSVGTGFGVQYNFTPNIGLFAEPSLQYFIPMHSDVETYRTEHPFTFSLPIGIRFTW